MTDVPADSSTTPPAPHAPAKRDWRATLASAELDTRLLGLLIALAVIWLAFHYLSGQGNPIDRLTSGKFITSLNLWNLSVQSSTIAIMATGMVLIIVSRNIDLSVGSMLGFIGYSMALVQTSGIFFLERLKIGSLAENSNAWIVAVLVGLALGAIIGTITGFIVSYGGVPAFIVTLGGLLVWRGLIFRLGGFQGQTIGLTNETFQRLGGNPNKSLGGMASWVFAVLACVGIVVSIYLTRRRKERFDLPVRPLWLDAVIGALGCIVVLAAVGLVANRYKAPITQEAAGIAYPVLILVIVTLGMTYLARRRRFGRYVYAYGGNPEAAELGGINTRRTVMLTFTLMGLLAAVSAIVLTARLNSAVNGLGVQYELDVIAAAVIGGTSFAGGIGTIPGAVLGAVVMQSLRSGMSLLNIDSPSQDIVVGVVLVTAVAIDSTIRLGRRKAALAALIVGLILAFVVIQTGRP
jgi:D-xylose transport system permease protein